MNQASGAVASPREVQVPQNRAPDGNVVVPLLGDR